MRVGGLIFLIANFDNTFTICYNNNKDNKGIVMTKVIGIRDLVRNASLLEEYDYVEIEDKRTHEYKGLFISPKYAQEMKQILDEKLAKEKEEKLNRLKKFIGSNKVQDRFNDLSSSEIRRKVAGEKYSDK